MLLEQDAINAGKVDNGALTAIPRGWVWTRLGDVAVKITDGEHFRPKTIDSGIYFLSAKDVRDEGIIFDNPLYISEEDAIKSRSRCDPEYGNILIVSRGATVGRSCIVKTNKLFCLLGSVILIKLSLIILNKYVSLILKSQSVKTQLTKLSGSTAQQAIYLRAAGVFD